MADYKVTDTELISIADAIRTKGGTSASLEFPTGFVSAVNAIPSGGGGTNDNFLIAIGAMSGSIYDVETSVVGGYAYYYRNADNGQPLTGATMTSVLDIGSHAFNGCSQLTDISFPACTVIRNYAFMNCSRLTSINFPNCVSVMAAAFSNCYGLTNADFPMCTFISNSVFQQCTNLMEISFPVCSAIGFGAFSRCSQLAVVSFPACRNIYRYAFDYCSKLESVYLLGDNIASLSNSDAFRGTPISSSTYLGYFGSIYVPASLLTQYQSASNWSFYSDRFVGLTDEEIAAL